jgi:hypothetical protein
MPICDYTLCFDNSKNASSLIFEKTPSKMKITDKKLYQIIVKLVKPV